MTLTPMPAMHETLDITLLQSDAELGDLKGNADRIARLARSVADAPTQLVITPELALSGYDLREGFEHAALEPAALAELGLPQPVLIGHPEAAPDGRIYNSATLLRRQAPPWTHRKIYLPTYGMFDEMRYFARGTRLRPVDHAGWRVGVLVCEDFWHPGLVYGLAMSGADLLVVMAGAPGRGVWEGGEAGPFASWDVWFEMARGAARSYGIYVALVNRAGVEGGATFAGGSALVSPSAEIVVAAPALEETVLSATLRRSDLVAARRPYSHLRDDEPSIVIEALEAAQRDAAVRERRPAAPADG